jgi:hypothetical protein
VAIALLVLAGCSHPATQAVTGTAQPHSLQGIVLDPALRPLPGAKVRAVGMGGSTVTDQHGAFFLDGLPTRGIVVLALSHTGYGNVSLQTSLEEQGTTKVRVILPALPSTAPWSELLEFKGSVGCQAVLVVGESLTQRADCPPGIDPGHTVWDFPVSPRLATAIIEIVWSPSQPLAEGLEGELRHVAGNVTTLADQVARSPMRLVLAQQVARQRFSEGGSLRLIVSAHPITAEDEQAIAAGVDIDQPFKAFASLFYGALPEPSYSILTAK